MFVVENGTSIPDATSLVSVETADAYFALRENATWSAFDEGQKEAFLVKGTAHLEKQFSHRFKGRRKNAEQILSFPRIDLVDSDGYNVPDNSVPRRVQSAVCEYAIRASKFELDPDPPHQSVGDQDTGSDDTTTTTTANKTVTRELVSTEVGDVKETTDTTYQDSGQRISTDIENNIRRNTTEASAETDLYRYPAGDLLLEPYLQARGSSVPGGGGGVAYSIGTGPLSNPNDKNYAIPPFYYDPYSGGYY